MVKIDKKLIQSLLANLTAVDTKKYSNNKGNLDIPKFNKNPFVAGTIYVLKKMGVDKNWLRENGYMNACIVLHF